MSATSSGALKALIEGLGLGIQAFRDRSIPGAVLPYAVVIEGLAIVPDPLEDGGAMGQTGIETCQVDLYQQWKVPPALRNVAESYTLAPALIRGLHGVRTQVAPNLVYGLLVRNSIRAVEEDNNLAVWHLTVAIFRQL